MKKQRITTFIWFSTILVLISFSLSVWQVYRLQWKQNLIDTLETRVNSPAITLKQAIKSGKLNSEDDIRYLKLNVNGLIDSERTILQVGRDHLGTPGYYVLSPIITPYGWVLVNLGNIKYNDQPDINKLRMNLKKSRLPKSITGIARPILKPQWFVPENAKGSPILLSIDLSAVSELLNLDLAKSFPFVVWSEVPVLPIGIDSAPSWTIDIANNHFVYALTWLLIGIGILIISIIWVRQKRLLVK